MKEYGVAQSTRSLGMIFGKKARNATHTGSAAVRFRDDRHGTYQIGLTDFL